MMVPPPRPSAPPSLCPAVAVGAPSFPERSACSSALQSLLGSLIKDPGAQASLVFIRGFQARWKVVTHDRRPLATGLGTRPGFYGHPLGHRAPGVLASAWRSWNNRLTIKVFILSASFVRNSQASASGATFSWRLSMVGDGAEAPRMFAWRLAGS